jgi:hypothetical protein
MPMTKPSLFMSRDSLQNAWVVDDLQRAMDQWISLWGVGPFFVMEHVPMENLHYRGQPSKIDCTIGLAQSGRTQIELIQQNCDNPSVYRDYVPKGRSGFHHIAVITKDYDREIAAYRSKGLAVAMNGTFGDMRFAYVDAWREVGSVIELIEDRPSIRDYFAKVAAAAEGWDGSDPVRRPY